MVKLFRNLFFIFAVTVSPAYATGEMFSQPAFDHFLKAGNPVLVVIHANWCSVCKAQDLVLDDLLKTAPFTQIKVLEVDFDKQRGIVHDFHARYQSTLIVFRKGREIDRSTADTDRNSIAEMLREAL